MKVRCLLFARSRDLAGSSTLELLLPSGATVQELRAALGRAAPALRPLLPHLLMARDNAYLNEDAILSEGNEIACIPPVSGG